MENLFCLVAPKPPEASGDGKGEGGANGEKKKKEMSEVNLLDGKRSLNINIFLRQFRRWGMIICLNSGRPISSTEVIHRVICQRPHTILILILMHDKVLTMVIIIMNVLSSNEDIIEMVVNGDYHEFEPEKLRGLMKILPEMDEVKKARNMGMLMIVSMVHCPHTDEYCQECP